MPASNFNGHLNPNLIYTALMNQILNQYVNSDNISGANTQLVEEAKKDVGLAGDKVLYYDTPANFVEDWIQDSDDALNLLAKKRSDAHCQDIDISKFKMIWITTDNINSQKAFADEGTMSRYNSVLTGWLEDTRKVYEGSEYSAFIGTETSSYGSQKKEIDVTTAVSGLTGDEKNRVRTETIARNIADIVDEMTDTTTDYNDLGYLRSFDPASVKIIWNKKQRNLLIKEGMPTIWRPDGLFGDKLDKYSLPARFFGDVCTTTNLDANAGSGKALTETATNKFPYTYTDRTKASFRAREACTVTISGTTYNVFAGELLPANCKIYNVTGETGEQGTNKDGVVYTNVYIENEKIICKIVTELPPYLTSVVSMTEFQNVKNHSSNKYLLLGSNKLQHLHGKPMVEVKFK